MKEKVLIAGGSGLIGQRLTELLIEKGYEVAHLSRSLGNSSSIKTIVWDVKNQKLDAEAIAPYKHIIHLAGAGIVDKAWTKERKKEILESRVQSTLLLKKAITQNSMKVLTYTSASAIGYYGMQTSDQIFKEEDVAAKDFVGNVGVAWEEAADEVAALGIPCSKIRIGLVLTDKGGALKKMALPIKLFVGSPLGSGNQYTPWIHIDDLCRIFIHSFENKLEGVYNAASPVEKQLNNTQLTKAIAKVLKKPCWPIKVPSFALKILMGERANLVLTGSRVDTSKIQNTGFQYQYKNIEQALDAIYS